ncbi:ribonuclease H-like domain-containing protein [Tanacetum coccineum]
MALMAFSDAEVSNDKSCLQNYEALKKQYDDLLVKLDDMLFNALHTKEVTREYLMGLLKTELKKVKEEKEGFEFKIAKFEKSSKDLDQLLASQITDKSKKGFGYNAIPSPHHLVLNRPTSLDLSYSGLQEFKQPEVNKTKDEASEILKNFIKEIENLVDKKVKTIRSDNGTEFMNKVMDDFCREKENKPMIEGNGPKWLFDLDSLTQSMNYVPMVAGKSSNDFAGIQGVFESSTSSQQDQDWILMPILEGCSHILVMFHTMLMMLKYEDKDEVHDEDDVQEEVS